MQIDFSTKFDLSNYGGTLFKPGSFDFQTSWQVPGVEPATPEGKEIQKLVGEKWKKEMEGYKNAKEKEYKDILLHTENALKATMKKKEQEFLKQNPTNPCAAAAKWMDEEAKGAGIMIEQALTTFKGILTKAMDALWVKVSTEIDKKFKTKIRNSKIKAVFKIIGLAIVIVAGAALTIAGAVLTGLAAPTGIGAVAGVGIALGGIATVAGAIKQIYEVYSASWPDHKTASANVTKKMKALQDALEYEEKKVAQGKLGEGAVQKLGPKERAKLFFANTKGKREDLGEAMKTLATWNNKMKQSVEKYAQGEELLLKKLQELANALASEKDKKKIAELEKAHGECSARIKQGILKVNNARIYLTKYDKLIEEAAGVVNTDSGFDSKALGSFLHRLSELASSDEVGVLVTFGKGTATFVGSLMKFLKK